jgi:type IV pilus assembly protein PilN
MIRINLLSEGRRPVVARKQKPVLALGSQDPSVFFLVGGLVLGLLVVGLQWYRLSSQIGDLDGQVSRKQAEVTELKPILDEVEDFKKKQADLERKIGVIEELTLKQKGPVHIMDQVSRALPELIWLTQMNVRGQTVDLSGTAYNTSAIASFIENLSKVKEFKEPDPRDVQRSVAQSYNFRISFSFVQQDSSEEDGAEG